MSTGEAWAHVGWTRESSAAVALSLNTASRTQPVPYMQIRQTAKPGWYHLSMLGYNERGDFENVVVAVSFDLLEIIVRNLENNVSAIGMELRGEPNATGSFSDILKPNENTVAHPPYSATDPLGEVENDEA